MRDYCLDCVIKHLGQAFVTQIESQQGYPDHILLTIGHLAEASEEAFGVSPELAAEIRQHRLMVMEDNEYQVPYFQLFNTTLKLIEEKGCGNCKKAKESFKDKLKDRKSQIIQEGTQESK